MTARVADRGYHRYAGPRATAGHATRTLVAHTLRRILGLRRPARAKVLPVLTIAMAFVPAIVFIGLIALFDQRVARFAPHYSEYYGYVTSAVVLFVTFVAPEAFCPDRRHRTISIYLATPLTRARYVTAKCLSVFLALLVVAAGPSLLYLLGLMVQNAGPDGPVGVVRTFARIVLSGLAVATVYTAVSAGVASLTERRAVASAATLLVVLGSNAVAGVLRAVTDEEGFLLLSLTSLPFAVARVIFGRRVFAFTEISPVATWTVAAAVTALGFGVCAAVYARLRVTR